jgi:gluconokinase
MVRWDPMQRTPETAGAVILMGVSGSGKTTVGQALAARLGWKFFDADDYHPAANVDKMRNGQPLTDDDRWPWLDRLRTVVEQELEAGLSMVLACSALRDVYRKRLLPHDPVLARRVSLVYLRISPETARQRLMARPGHYMPPSLVPSQFAALEAPAGAIEIDGEAKLEEVVAQIVSRQQNIPLR